MPIWDYRCPVCGGVFERFTHGTNKVVFCPHCAAECERLPAAPNVIADSIPGGVVIENLGHEPRKFYSKSEIKLAAEMAGLSPAVRHVGVPGSDKNPNTQRWT